MNNCIHFMEILQTNVNYENLTAMHFKYKSEIPFK